VCDIRSFSAPTILVADAKKIIDRCGSDPLAFRPRNVEGISHIMQIWPAIDLRGGQCVRLQQGDYQRETVFSDDPAETARRFAAAGAQCLHVVDLDGARAGRPVNVRQIRAIRQAVGIPCELGGGIRDEATIAEMLELGIDRLVIGSRALQDPGWFRHMCARFPHRLALGVDARDGRVASGGWLETSNIEATTFVGQFSDAALAAVIFTDIAADGMLAGPNFAALDAMQQATTAPIIASGGVTTVQHVAQLARLGLAGCIIGRALYEGKINLRDALEAVAATKPNPRA
jgi:phosphoribosylformimino-5-aminoimidazole carboxamide ribotide isomerase